MNWYKIAQEIKQSPNLNMFMDETTVYDYDRLLQNPQEISQQSEYESVKVEYMSPDEYINRIKAGFWNNLPTDKKLQYRSTEGYWDQEVSKRLVSSKAMTYARAALKGSKFPMPYLKYDLDDGHMTQEGHHRAQAAKILGIKSIPVCMVNDEYSNRETDFDAEQEELKDEAMGFIEELDSYHEIEKIFWRFIDEYEFINEDGAMDWYEEQLEIAQDDNDNPFLFNLENLTNAIKAEPYILQDVQEYMAQHNIDPTTATIPQIMAALKHIDDLSVFWRYMYTWEKMLAYLNHLGIIDGDKPAKHSDAAYKLSSRDWRRIFTPVSKLAENIVRRMNEDQLLNTVNKARLYQKTNTWKSPLKEIEDFDERWKAKWKAEKEYEKAEI